MPVTSKLKTVKTLSIAALVPIAFYGLVGVLFLVLLPFANYPPHIALTGIISVITAYGLFTKRLWAKWLVVVLFFVATTLSLCTLYYFIFSDWIVSASMIAYVAFTWVFTARTLSKSKAA
jgi:hypothetical protein